MKTKKNTRLATWLALAMGIAAATSVEAAVVYKSNSGFTISTGSAPLFFEGTTAYLLFSAASGDTGGEPSVWAVTNSWASDIRRVNVNDEIGAGQAFSNSLNASEENGMSYYGIIFTNGGTTNYGWMQLTASGFGDYDSTQSVTVNAYAYDNTGASIKVGATSAATSAVPEASTSLGLLALGAGGLLTRRRQKRAA